MSTTTTNIGEDSTNKASYWSKHVSKSTGKEYWFNSKTQESRYENPFETAPTTVVATNTAAVAATNVSVSVSGEPDRKRIRTHEEGGDGSGGSSTVGGGEVAVVGQVQVVHASSDESGIEMIKVGHVANSNNLSSSAAAGGGGAAKLLPTSSSSSSSAELVQQQPISASSKVELYDLSSIPKSGSAADVILYQKCGSLPPPKPIMMLPECPAGFNMWNRKDIQVNDYLAQVYREEFIINAAGEKIDFQDVTNPIQGRHIYNVIKNNNYKRTLEVGFAMGASAVWINQAHKDLNHTGCCHIAVDPNQSTQYKGIGRHLLKQCGLDSYMRVMEDTSYRALPRLLDAVVKGTEEKFDFIYIDGWHTFDYTLIDFFYADLLLNVNGTIILDDVNVKHKGCHCAHEYIRTNFTHFELVKKTPNFDIDTPQKNTQATYIKRSNDERGWAFHNEWETTKPTYNNDKRNNAYISNNNSSSSSGGRGGGGGGNNAGEKRKFQN